MENKVKTIDKVLIKYLYHPEKVYFDKKQNRLKVKEKTPYGVVVAIDRNQIGWSLCHKDDKFDKNKGKMIAINRSFNLNRDSIPHTIMPYFKDMEDRAQTYFKD